MRGVYIGESESEECRTRGAVKLSVCVRVDHDGMRGITHLLPSTGLVCERGTLIPSGLESERILRMGTYAVFGDMV
jgi:hypothetical protein